jgi:alkane 1-monooxygenase
VLLLDKTYIQLVYLFVILPLVDTFIPLPVKLLEPKKNTVLHDILLYSWYPTEILFFVLHIYLKRTSVIDTLVMGVILGLGINIAHELIHKRHFLKKFIGRRILELTCYGFWEWQHIKGHHVNVGRKNDPATAQYNTSVYYFIPKSIIGTIIQSFQINKLYFIWSIMNTLIIAYIFYYFGALRFYLTSCLYGIILLEQINYIEHYGLERSENELISEIHSWDAPYVMSSLILFKLPLHADHHLHAYKNYPELSIKEKAPKLPFSYPTMIIISVIPPLFYKIVHQKLTNNIEFVRKEI